MVAAAADIMVQRRLPTVLGVARAADNQHPCIAGGLGWRPALPHEATAVG
jgi:hypothetical protein